MKKLAAISLLFIVVLLTGCKKNDDNFVYCTGCLVDEWVGYFEGTGAYFAPNPSDNADNIEVSINVLSNGGTKLTIAFDAPGYITESFTTSKNDDYHFINIAANERSIDLGLSKKGNEYRLTGTVKLNRYNKIDDTWEVDRSVSFETYKH